MSLRQSFVHGLVGCSAGVAAVGAPIHRGHAGGVIWLTGLSGAGKSTIACATQVVLICRGYRTCILDGDRLREGINADLGFSPAARRESVRRVAHIAKLFADTGVVVITALISPYAADREMARHTVGRAFSEVFVHATVASCERRDPRGLYRLARAGGIAEFTGISAPYERPDAPAFVIDTERLAVADAVDRLVAFVEARVNHED